jgi:hypothetical protein
MRVGKKQLHLVTLKFRQISPEHDVAILDDGQLVRITPVKSPNGISVTGYEVVGPMSVYQEVHAVAASPSESDGS